jgi:hypothetical protein
MDIESKIRDLMDKGMTRESAKIILGISDKKD